MPTRKQCSSLLEKTKGTFLDMTEKKIKGSQKEKLLRWWRKSLSIECDTVTITANKISIWSFRWGSSSRVQISCNNKIYRNTPLWKNPTVSSRRKWRLVSLYQGVRNSILLTGQIRKCALFLPHGSEMWWRTISQCRPSIYFY